ncbi:MAG: hypothetical protein KA063_04935 [Firmicutes bacterium]|nr:hypothetical protein [Bacillota bacterium]
MRIRYQYTRDGQALNALVEFDHSGSGHIVYADDAYIRNALEAALNATLEYETGELRDGALATIPVRAEPGTPEHADGMVNPRILIDKGIGVVQIED